MTPKTLHAAYQATITATEAAQLVQSPLCDALQNAAAVLRAVAAFGDALANGEPSSLATRHLAAAILGFDIDPADPRAAYMLEAYTRWPR